MKFQVAICVTSGKTGIELADEYERLGFAKQPAQFGMRRLNVDVPVEFARAHRAAFIDDTAVVNLDAAQTQPSDWEDWGSAGHMLRADAFDIDRLGALLDRA